jgi:hypothetical protein
MKPACMGIMTGFLLATLAAAPAHAQHAGVSQRLAGRFFGARGTNFQQASKVSQAFQTSRSRLSSRFSGARTSRW